MKWHRILGVVFLLYAVTGCIGCANGPVFSPAKLQSSEAVVYIYRPSGSYQGSSVGLPVQCDDEKLGYLWSKGYLYKVVPPGKHIVSSSTEQKSEVPFTAKAGESYFIEAEVEMEFFIGRPKLIMVPSDHGESAILGMKYLGSA